MSDTAKKVALGSYRRVVRTVYQIIVALVTYIPLVFVALPIELTNTEIALTLGAWVAVITQVINSLEDAGAIPSWLKEPHPDL